MKYVKEEKKRELDKVLEKFLDERKALTDEFKNVKKEFHENLNKINVKISQRTKELAGKNIRKHLRR